ncbi:hypothetical protein MMC13_003418 [Lambiella insularis]|nr:hypothetical protein [Lambiella insularis]
MAHSYPFDYSLDSNDDFATLLEDPTEDPTTFGQSYTQGQESSYADISQTAYPGGVLGPPSTPQLNSVRVQPTFALGKRPPPGDPAVGHVNKFLRPASLTARPTTRLPQEGPLTTLPRPPPLPARGLKAEPADGNSTVAEQGSSLGTRATLTQEQSSRIQQCEAQIRRLDGKFEALRTKLLGLEVAKFLSLVKQIEDEQKRQAAQMRDMIDMVARLVQELIGN